jgi:hypothetical protein
MGSVKTTVEIADSLFEEARSVARARGLSLRVLIEEGLLHVIESRRKSSRFRLRDGSFQGKGLQRDFSWTEMRQAIYQGRGE